jgi:hypothetical protein
MKSVTDIYDIFQRQFADGKLEGWFPGVHRGHTALDASNRYLMPKKDVPDADHIPFDEAVDPHGILEAMRKTGYVHTEENVVHYYVRQIDEKGDQWWVESTRQPLTYTDPQQSFEPAGPQIFHIGDIVEAQVSFIVIPLKGKSAKMLTILHSIALLNTEITKVRLVNGIRRMIQVRHTERAQ